MPALHESRSRSRTQGGCDEKAPKARSAGSGPAVGPPSGIVIVSTVPCGVGPPVRPGRLWARGSDQAAEGR